MSSRFYEDYKVSTVVPPEKLAKNTYSSARNFVDAAGANQLCFTFMLSSLKAGSSLTTELYGATQPDGSDAITVNGTFIDVSTDIDDFKLFVTLHPAEKYRYYSAKMKHFNDTETMAQALAVTEPIHKDGRSFAIDVMAETWRDN